MGIFAEIGMGIVHNLRKYRVSIVILVIILGLTIVFLSNHPTKSSDYEPTESFQYREIIGSVIGILIAVGIVYALTKLKWGKESESKGLYTYNIFSSNSEYMCYAWFFLIYFGIWFTIISIIVVRSKIISKPGNSDCVDIFNNFGLYNILKIDITYKDPYYTSKIPSESSGNINYTTVTYVDAKKTKTCIIDGSSKFTTTTDLFNYIHNIESS